MKLSKPERKLIDNDDLHQYCAPGTEIQVDYTPVNSAVKLRVIHFSPPDPEDLPEVVFVPGWISRMESWKEVLQEMTRNFRIHYVETREKISSVVHGPAEFSVEALGKDLIAIIRQLQLRDNQYIMLGSSLGATVILDCCLALPARPRALVLVGPNAVFRVPWWGKIIIHLFYPGFYTWIKPYIKWYLRHFRLDVKSDHLQYEKYCRALDSADPFKLKKAALAFSRYQVWDKLPHISIPTLILGGSRDKLHEPENMKKIASMMPHATYMDMGTNRMTHSIHMVRILREFLTSLENSAASQ